MTNTEQLLRRMTGSITAYMDEVGARPLRMSTADRAVLAVRDDGIGIAPEQQERIWQRFYQVDPARSGGEGTGLGLYMVRQIARLHGGTAEVDSAPGQGSTFTVRIPAHRK